MSGPDAHNYTDLPNGMRSPSSARIIAEETKTNKVSRLSNLTLLLGVITVIGSLAFVISTGGNRTTNTRAASDTLAPSTNATLPESTALLTDTVLEYPKKYNNDVIPSSLVSDGESKFSTVDGPTRKKYVINRIVLYYILKDVLKSNNIPVDETGNLTFTTLENRLPIMISQVNSTLLSKADYGFIKVYFNALDEGEDAKAKFGDDLQPKALELIQKYHDLLQANPENYQQIIADSNNDEDMKLLTHGEANVVITDYFADQNNVPAQDSFIYDEAFDTILFSLEPNKVSDVIILNGLAPYMYIVVYPTRIEIKKYQSIKDIVAEKLPLFSY